MNRWLAGWVLLMVLVAARPALRAQAETPSELEELERQVLTQVNAQRRERGLAPLVTDPWLTRTARTHSRDMAAGRRPFGHDGFSDRYAQARQALHVGQFGENVAYDFILSEDLVSGVMKRWMSSEAHRRNILENFNATGIGVWPAGDGKVYFTQLFARMGTARAVPAESAPIPRGSPFPGKGR